MTQAEMLEKEQTYLKLALAHAKATGRGGQNQPDLPTIQPGSPEWTAWQRYFLQSLGFLPVMMRRVERGQSRAMTVPARVPQDFDGSYQPLQLVR